MEAGPVCGRAQIGKPQMGHRENVWGMGVSIDEAASTTREVHPGKSCVPPG